MKTDKNPVLFMTLAAISGFIAVFAGAFGAHMMEQFVSPERLGVWETGVRYQFFHTLILFMTGWLYRQQQIRWLNYSAWCFVGGMLVFSGSLYLLVLLNMPVLGMVTPLGGLLLMAGWILLSIGAGRLSRHE